MDNILKNQAIEEGEVDFALGSKLFLIVVDMPQLQFNVIIGLDVPSTLIATINLDDDVSSTSSATSTASEGGKFN